MAALLCEMGMMVVDWISINDKEGDTGLKADPGSTGGCAADDRAHVGLPP